MTSRLDVYPDLCIDSDIRSYALVIKVDCGKGPGSSWPNQHESITSGQGKLLMASPV